MSSIWDKYKKAKANIKPSLLVDDQNFVLENVNVKGTNLRNSLIVCGVAIACYMMFFKKKKRG